ncbi:MULTISPECIES: DUF3054 domain-containing protein [Corynebacterium]|uniref:DUF3054 domain-containing protein n=2 Tax=Corynebacterium TaxID=1716 RepID=A0A3G6IRZ8_9CORY|nr:MULTISPECIES: DUF3054 domain-containing protein [Corynebacterium]AZA08336.1 hypothetical protein CPPEL_00940 [Corynebacterium pseudopelargi]QAU51502.1 hypothetical protein CPELA_01005 [Corynebacterium pelargi]GGG79607.1 membrane protein [Corynebacterium pelargi]
MKTLGIDLIAVFIFAVLARLAHGGLGVVAVLDTFWPFAIGAVLGNLLGRGRGLVVWLCTAITGLAIWGVRHGEIPHWSFIIVASLMSAVLLLGWRRLWQPK